MKKLDLNALDVVELDEKEVMAIEGGGKGFWFAIADAIADYLQGLYDGYKDFKKKN